MNKIYYDDGTPEIVMFLVILAVISSVYTAYHMAEAINLPFVKSDKELCQERGGVWVYTRPNYLCLNKDALK